MEKLLAMILTAYDPRRNPVAGLLWYHASQSCRFVVQLCKSMGAKSEPAEKYYTTNCMKRTDNQACKTARALTTSGRLVDVRVAMSL